MLNYPKMPCYLMALVVLAQGAGALEAGNTLKGEAWTYPVWEGGAKEAPAQKVAGAPVAVPAPMKAGIQPTMGAADRRAKARRQKRCAQKNRKRRQEGRQRQSMDLIAAGSRRDQGHAEPCPGTGETAEGASAPAPRRSPGRLGRLVALALTFRTSRSHFSRIKSAAASPVCSQSRMIWSSFRPLAIHSR